MVHRSLLALLFVLLPAAFCRLPAAQAAVSSVGIYRRADCTTIHAPVVGKTFCFEQTTNSLKKWDGARWRSLNITEINAADFGAKGDGVADDTTAIQKAANAARALKALPLRLPGPNHLITKPLNLTNGSTSPPYTDGWIIQGSNRINTRITCKLSVARPCLELIGSQNATVRNLNVYGDPTGSQSVAILFGREATSHRGDNPRTDQVVVDGYFAIGGIVTIGADDLLTLKTEINTSAAAGFVGDYIYCGGSSCYGITPAYKTIDSTTGNTHHVILHSGGNPQSGTCVAVDSIQEIVGYGVSCALSGTSTAMFRVEGSNAKTVRCLGCRLEVYDSARDAFVLDAPGGSRNSEFTGQYEVFAGHHYFRTENGSILDNLRLDFFPAVAGGTSASMFTSSGFCGAPPCGPSLLSSNIYTAGVAMGTINPSNTGGNKIRYASESTRWALPSGVNTHVGINVGATISGIVSLDAGGGAVPGKNFRGSVEISGTNTSATVTFGTAEPDSNYYVLHGCRPRSGTPATGSCRVSNSTRQPGSFMLHTEVAPGAGNSVLVDWLIVR